MKRKRQAKSFVSDASALGFALFHKQRQMMTK